MVVAILLFSIVLVRLPAVFGDSPPPIVALASLIPFFAGLGALLLWKGTWRVRGLHLLLLVVYVALLVIAIMRAAAIGTVIGPGSAARLLLTWVPIAMLGAFAFLRERREDQVARYFRALCWAPAVYVGVNVLLYLGGFSIAARAAASGENVSASVLQLVGVAANRVLFPLAGGINGFGAIAGVALATTAMLFIRGHGSQRIAAAAGAFAALFALVAIDSRGSLLFAVGAVLLVVLVPRARARGIAGLPLMLPLLPVLLIAVLTSLADNPFAAQFAREGTNLATGTNRSIVWGEIANFLVQPRFEHLTGYGAFGQLASGVSTGYYQAFKGFDQPLLGSAHNFVLQTVLDVGWLGLIATIALCVVVVRQLGLRYARFGRPEDGALLAGAVSLLLIGTVDPSPTQSLQDGFTFWLLLLAAALRRVPEQAPMASPRLEQFAPLPGPAAPHSEYVLAADRREPAL